MKHLFINQPLISLIEINITNTLLAEWSIWSRCFGKVVIISGTSSAGKTTLSEYFKKFGFNLLSQDNIFIDLIIDNVNKEIGYIHSAKSFLTRNDMLKVLRGHKVKEGTYNQHQEELIHYLQVSIYLKKETAFFPSKLELYDKMYDCARKFIFSGQDVIIDAVISQPSFDVLSYSFGYYPIIFGILYAPLEENLIKCFHRNCVSLNTDEVNYRYPSQVIQQYVKLYNFLPKNKISKIDQILEEINKPLVSKALKSANCFEEKLLSRLDNLKVFKYEPVDHMFNLLIKAQEIMKLNTKNIMCVVPAMKCNFVIQNIHFRINEELIKRICDMIRSKDFSLSEECSIFVGETMEQISVLGEKSPIELNDYEI